MIALVLSNYANGQSALIYIQNQKPAPASDLLKSLEIALVELEAARKVNSLHREQVDALRAKISALEALVAIERQRGDAYKAASVERATANELDSKRVALFEESLKEFRTELLRVREERDSARRRNKWFAAAGFVLGGIGVALIKK